MCEQKIPFKNDPDGCRTSESQRPRLRYTGRLKLLVVLSIKRRGKRKVTFAWLSIAYVVILKAFNESSLFILCNLIVRNAG